MANTRAQLTCPVYDIECELNSCKLPTVKKVMQHYSFVQSQHPRTTKPSIIVSQVSANVENRGFYTDINQKKKGNYTDIKSLNRFIVTQMPTTC